MIYTGQMSNSYSLEIAIFDSTRDLIGFLVAGKQVVINIMATTSKRDFLFSGIIISCIGDTYNFKLLIHDYAFYILSNYKVDSFISGEFSLAIGIPLLKYGVPIYKRYPNAVILNLYAHGFFRDFIDITARNLGLVWNASGEKLIIGDGLTGNISTLDSISDKIKTNSITYKGSLINLITLNAGYSPNINVGDKLILAFKTFIVVAVQHNLYINDIHKVDNRKTIITMLSDVQDIVNYVAYNHDMRRTFELNDVSRESIKFDLTTNSLLFYNPRIGKWLGELSKASWADDDSVPDAYLWFGKVKGNASVGYYTPNNIYVVGMTFRMDAADNTSFEIIRDGILVYSVNTNNVRRGYVNIDKEMPGNAEFAIKRSNSGSAHIYNVIVTLQYRRIV